MNRLSKERLATFSIFLANGFGMGAWASAVPRIKDNLHLTASALGIALFAFALGAMIAMPIAGRLTPRIGSGRSTALLAGVFVIALSMPALAPNFDLLCLVLIVLGASNGALDVSMNGHASMIERVVNRPIMSSFHAAWSAGALFGAGAGALIQKSGGGALAGLLIPALAAATAAVGAALFGLREVGPRAQSAHSAAGWSSTPVRTLASLAFLAMLVEGAVADWSAVFLRGALSGFPSQAIIGYTCFAFSMTVCRLAGDWVIKTLGPETTMVVGSLSAALGFAACLAAPSLLSASVGFTLVGIGLANVIPVIFSAAGKATRDPAAGLSVTATLGYAGFLVGPPLIGFTASIVTLRYALLLPVLALVIIMSIGRRVIARAPQNTQ